LNLTIVGAKPRMFQALFSSGP